MLSKVNSWSHQVKSHPKTNLEHATIMMPDLWWIQLKSKVFPLLFSPPSFPNWDHCNQKELIHSAICRVNEKHRTRTSTDSSLLYCTFLKKKKKNPCSTVLKINITKKKCFCSILIIKVTHATATTFIFKLLTIQYSSMYHFQTRPTTTSLSHSTPKV